MTTSMPMGNSGAGGNVFGQQTLNAEDLRTSAWTEINKAALGIVNDSIEQVFTQMSPRYTTGYLGGFGYKASPDQPLLDHPLESIRRLMNLPTLPEDSWKTSYEQLVNQLPSDLLTRFQQEMQLPLDDRNTSFVGLDNLFTAAAKFLTKVSILSQPDAIDSLPSMRTSLNLLLPFAALKNSSTQGFEITDNAQQLLNELGPNYRYFDGLSSLISDLKNNLGTIQSFDSAFAKSGYSSELSSANKEALGDLANRLNTLHTQLQRINLGDELQILDPLLKTMTLMTASLSLPNTGSAALFLGLSLASIGLNDESATNVLGNSFQTVTESTVNGILTQLMPNANFGEQQMLHMATNVSFALLTALAARSAEEGIGSYSPEAPPSETKSAQFFTFELALLFGNSSGTINNTFGILVETSGGDEAAQATASPILGQLATMLMILAATREGKQPITHLIEAQREYLEAGVNAAKEAQEQKEEIEADNEKAAITAMAVKQSQIALEEKDYDAFLDTYSTLLESLNSSLDDLLNDIDTIRNAASTATPHLTDYEGGDQPITDIHNVV